MDQTDGSSVLACDRRLHRGGLAPGFQLSSVKSLEEEGVKKKKVSIARSSVRKVSQTLIRLTW